MKTLEFTAQYKLGHTMLKCRTIIAARNISYIQQVPEEVPEYADGSNSRVGLPNGQDIMAVDRFDDISSAYSTAMAEES